MNHTITNAAGITILEPLDNNFKTGGGPVSIGGCVVVASKGKPFVPLEIQPESTWSGGKTSLEQILGSPLSKKAYGMEGLRQLSDACKECSWVNAVRVVSTKGYRYPSLAFLMFRDLKTAWATDTSYKPGDLVTDADKQWVCAVAHVASAANKPGTETGEWLPFSGPVETAAHRYNEEVLVGDDGFWMVFYPIDGCDCQKRTVRIEDVDTARQRFTLSIYEKDDAGYESLLEGYEVGIGEDDKDDMGRPAYIETVFETRSSHFRCDFLEGTAWEDLEPILLSLEWKKSTPQLFSFSGGTDGGVPELADWLQATSVFSNEQVQVNLLFAAGNVEPDFIAKQAEIADDRHISYFFDVPSVPFPFAGIGVGQGVGAEEPPCALLLFSP
ncbi:carbohydrate-binding protein [Bilophila wadsworthia]